MPNSWIIRTLPWIKNCIHIQDGILGILERHNQAKIIKKSVFFGFLIWSYDVNMFID